VSTLEEVVSRQRAAFARNIDDPMLAQLADDYRKASADIERRALAAAERAAEATAEGRDPFVALLEQQRLQELQRQVEEEIRRISFKGPRLIGLAQRAAIVAAVSDASGMALEVGVKLNTIAVARLTAAFADESPLFRLFSALPDAAARAVRERLIQGVILGQNPRVTANRIAVALNGNGARALTIARTETLRAYRGASQEMYRNNRQTLGAWMWISACDRRTCGVCFAMHGTVHPLDEQFGSHPSCRCGPAPVPRVMPPSIQTGISRFDNLPEEAQRQIIGPAKLAAYREGRIELPDLVGVAEHPEWGQVRYERSLTSILGSEASRYYRRAA